MSEPKGGGADGRSGFNPVCMEFVCSPCDHLGFLWVTWFLPQHPKHVRLGRAIATVCVNSRNWSRVPMDLGLWTPQIMVENP